VRWCLTRLQGLRTDYPDHDPRRGVLEDFFLNQFTGPFQRFATGLHQIHDNLALEPGQHPHSDFDNLGEVGWIAYRPDACTVSGVCPEVFCSLDPSKLLLWNVPSSW
jgi:hypothetical protein